MYQCWLCVLKNASWLVRSRWSGTARPSLQGGEAKQGSPEDRAWVLGADTSGLCKADDRRAGEWPGSFGAMG